MAADLRFVYITFCVEQAFFAPVWQGMEDAARQLGVICERTGVRGIDDARQIALIEEAVERGCDGIALNLPQLRGFERILTYAQSRGIPIVGFNDDVRGAGDTRLAHISQRLYDAGVLLGERTRAHISPGAHVIVSLHSADAQALEQRRAGIVHALADLRVAETRLVTTTDPIESRDMLLRALSRDPSITAVLATGQADTQGAGLAAKQLGRPLYVCGFDESPEIGDMVRAGVIDFTILQQPYAQGFYPAVMLALYARKGIRPSDIDAGAVFLEPMRS